MDFKEIYLSFNHIKFHTHTLKWLQGGSPEIISSHRMKKLLNKGHSRVISHFQTMQVLNNIALDIHLDFQRVLDKHQQVFETPKGLSPSRGEHDHSIPLILGSQPPKVCPYRHPFSQKNGIKKII